MAEPLEEDVDRDMDDVEYDMAGRLRIWTRRKLKKQNIEDDYDCNDFHTAFEDKSREGEAASITISTA